MVNIILIEATRDEYSKDIAAEKSITVGELINELGNYNSNDKIIISNDNGYTYGILNTYKVSCD